MIVQGVRNRILTFSPAILLGVLLILIASSANAGQAEQVIAIAGATVIDGNGGPPVADRTILVRGNRIAEMGPRDSIQVPAGARVIDGNGKFVTPGFIDTNVHMSLAFGRRWNDSNARYWDRHSDLVLEGVQLHLKHGVTTIRDSYGALLPMIEVRDAIARGDEVGPRMYVAGNIVGWGGPYSETFSRLSESELTLFEEQINDAITQGSGEEWTHMAPDELRVAINDYLDKDPDFIKYGGTSHSLYPGLIGFSPRAQKVIVEETQKRGLVAETHSTTLEGLRLSVLAGLDLIQHPEAVGRREITDELINLIVERQVICSIISNAYSGEAWKWHRKQREKALQEQAEASQEPERRAPKTSAEIRREKEAAGIGMELRRRNAEKLISAGCIVTVGTDNLLFGYRGVAPEFLREKHAISEHQEPGIGTILGIEGLVELGMTPSEAIVAATKNGALACKALDEFGTVEKGKIADLLLLDANPLADISNIRKLGVVMRGGQIIDRDKLATKSVLHKR